MNILGINAYHGDSAACLVRDGILTAAVEEERFRRVKHWAGFPSESIRYCLGHSGLSLQDLHHVAVNRNPWSHWPEKLIYAIGRPSSLSSVLSRIGNAAKIQSLGSQLKRLDGSSLTAAFHHVNHHRAHLASAFYVSPFQEAAVVSVDGFGDFASSMWGKGVGASLQIRGRVLYPHSLGIFYLALTQYLGFKHYGDEYKVMGLAAYGKPSFLPALREVARPAPKGEFRLNLKYFIHSTSGVRMTWNETTPVIGDVYSPHLEKLLGPARKPSDPLEDRHRDIAASAQAAYEEVFFHVIRHAQKETAAKALCLAGGCGFNSVANGRLFEETGFREIYVQPASGDAGGAIGAAFDVWHKSGGMRKFVMNHAYWGPAYENDIAALLNQRAGDLIAAACSWEQISSEELLIARTAEAIAAGKVVGWFQGRTEWGPRALGNRSILGDPRRADMKDILNVKIKRRETFRPFAPSVLRERVGAWFKTDYESPFMTQVYSIRPERRATIPAVTHVDGSGRLQTVARDQNMKYYDLIRGFEKISGVPMILNTSFNENEPVVLRPQEALDCFLRTKMDVLVLGEHYLARDS